MKGVHIVGRKNHGKTLLVRELIPALMAQGLRVATFKHCGHAHDLDQPGKDSYLHRQAGATAVAVATPEMTALFRPAMSGTALYSQFDTWFAGADLVLIEGHVDGPGPKIEVWRAAVGGLPLALERGGITGVVTNDPIDTTLPCWTREDVATLARDLIHIAEEL
jgi:molybdopterin-guanine dinucleotide biosynthesis protein B